LPRTGYQRLSDGWRHYRHHPRHDEEALDVRLQRVNFLYFSRCGMTESVPRRRILSCS
jgi:hypothetical protein